MDGSHEDVKDEKLVKTVVKTLNRVPREFKQALSFADVETCRRLCTNLAFTILSLSTKRASSQPVGSKKCAVRVRRIRRVVNDYPRRCRNTGLECLFEKPTRETTLTGEAGLERIRSLEAHVADIRQTQASIQSSVAEVLALLRGGGMARSPSYPPQSYNQSPHSPMVASPPSAHPHQNEVSHHLARPRHQGHPSPPAYPPHYQQSNVLPPFSSIQTMGPPASQANISSVRYDGHSRQAQHNQPTRRHASGSANVTSADSSDMDDEDNGELPETGLVAPLEVLRGLADVATERAAHENGDSSGPHSRGRTPSPDPQSRKRRKLHHKSRPAYIFPDVVTKNIVSEAEARELFRIFYHGCSTFLPVFDCNSDTFDALHERSPFAVDCICMVAARVRDGGGRSSQTYLQTLEEVQTISRATLFSPVSRHEAVQAMILVAGWADNGWLSGGHAVRMVCHDSSSAFALTSLKAMELSMHKAWPALLKRMNSNQVDLVADRELVVASRIWFCLYLFEHQLSYGTGRPAVLKDDESIKHCRLLLQHPLAIEDDMRLVSTVELMALRERVHNALSPFDGPVKDEHFEELRRADVNFRSWYATWDQAFSQKYEDAAFYRQSLQIQHLHAELFHNATALRGINGPEDVQNMPQQQKHLALRSIQIARQGLDITVNSPAYREGMKYAVNYTHATATFAASFLLRLSRLFPNDSEMAEIRNQVERLATLMAEIPGKRYALTLQVMLKRSRKRKSASSASRSPKTTRDAHHPMAMPIDQGHHQPQHPEPFSPYDATFASPTTAHPPHPPHHPSEAEHIWRGFEMTASEQLPVWISDQSLGGNSFSQNGINAFLLPQDYLPATPQIW
ncbi:Fungal-trans domain-containing protein [Mycena indigotica]|uniref:Fungal-trans domain-containing protein n=1 Tax=Mycena indigotica TaxID=2126181 RepID=A0A8H6W8C5_9AGAR|nr:Fungal-trans domain-containing protein [Mycena indigotica]KAF7306766.1 Fungal-trans domain-containing protein [Mycena indigotica]